MERGEPDFKSDYGETGGCDYMYDKATVWNREVCGDGHCLLCAEGYSSYVSTWGVWYNGDEETNCTKYCKGYAIEALFQDRGFGYVYAFCGDMDGHKYKIQ